MEGFMTESGGLSRIGQIAMRAQDLDRAIRFYRDTLGLKFLFTAPPQLAFFDCNGVRLLLDVPLDKEFDHPGSILYFAVDDIKEMHRLAGFARGHLSEGARTSSRGWPIEKSGWRSSTTAKATPWPSWRSRESDHGGSRLVQSPAGSPVSSLSRPGPARPGNVELAQRPIGPRRCSAALATKQAAAVFFLRGLFVPNNELFSRARRIPAIRRPESPSSSGPRFRNSTPSPMYGRSPICLQLVLVTNSRISFSLLSGEPGRQAWSEDAIAIGPHFKSLQMLDACEPKLVAVRQQPAAFKSLVAGEVFEPGGARLRADLQGIAIPPADGAGWVVMGLSDLGTTATARISFTRRPSRWGG